jgi:CheY-like chemotaxis protein
MGGEGGVATGGERGVVLVVDDDREWRDVVALALAWAGFPSVTAADGLEGLRTLRRLEVPPLAVILDLSMPRLTGWEFREAQLRDAALRDVPVVVVSGDDLGPTSAQRYLHKPCSLDALLDAVRSLTPIRAAA